MTTRRNPIHRRHLGPAVLASLTAIWLVAAAAMLTTVSALGAAAEPRSATDQQLYDKAEEAWRAAWERFYDERTHLFYDYVCSYDPQKRLAGLPTPEETRRQYPNRNGWGTGMEDCAISGGLMLSMICDRFAATEDPKLHESAEKVFAGLVLLGTLSPSEGFVIRGVCPVDGRSHYCESSRDQYTWYAYGLWRYYRSPLSQPAEKATIRKILAAICGRLERNVVPAHDYRIGREDGTFDTVVDKMWENAAHEVARLPMVYAIGADVTGDRHWAISPADTVPRRPRNRKRSPPRSLTRCCSSRSLWKHSMNWRSLRSCVWDCSNSRPRLEEGRLRSMALRAVRPPPASATFERRTQ